MQGVHLLDGQSCQQYVIESVCRFKLHPMTCALNDVKAHQLAFGQQLWQQMQTAFVQRVFIAPNAMYLARPLVLQ